MYRRIELKNENHIFYEQDKESNKIIYKVEQNLTFHLCCD